MSDIVKDSKRKAIIEAAEDEFVQKGYDGARILEIAERAERAVLVSWDDSNGSVTDKLCKIIGDHFDFVKENVDYLRFQFQEMERHPELFEEIKKTAQQEIARISNILQDDLNAEAAAGSINSMDAQTLLEDILALNLFFHLTAPTLYKTECLKNDNDYYEKRKKENISLILNRLIPQNPEQL